MSYLRSLLTRKTSAINPDPSPSPRIEYHVDLLSWYVTTESSSYGLPDDRVIVYVEPSNYVNPTFFFEAVLWNDVSGKTVYAQLYNLTDGVVIAGSEIIHDTDTPTRVRSGALTLPSAAKEYAFQFKTDTGGTGYVNVCRINVVDEFEVLTVLEHQIEIGHREYTLSDTFVSLSRPKTYLFEGDKFDGSLTIYFEATIYVGAGAKSIEARLYNFTDGVPVAGSTISSNSKTPVRVRSGSLTLVSGKMYRVQFRSTLSGKQARISGAKIITQQTAAEITKTQIIRYVGIYAAITAILEYYRGRHLANQIYLNKSNLPSGLTFYYEVELFPPQTCTDLFNVTDDVSVSGSEYCGDGRWRSGSLTLQDLKEYDSRLKATQTSITVHMNKGWIIIDYVETVETRTVEVTDEALDKTQGYEGDEVVYTATVLDNTAEKLPATFVVDLEINGTKVITGQVLDAAVYDQTTGLLTLTWTVPADVGAFTVSLVWAEQLI